jgi:DNA invertase Pin-like site-specific DNA recombinase
MHVARVYLRVSTQGQDLDRQESIIAEARDAGYYIAGVTARRHPALAPTGRSCFV